MIKIIGLVGEDVFRPSTWANILVHQENKGLHIVMCAETGVKCIKVCVKSPEYARIVQFAVDNNLTIIEEGE